MPLSHDRRFRSPNYNDRPAVPGGREAGAPARAATAIDMIVLHYTGMRTAQDALERLCDKAAGVSAHYLVTEEGRIHALVDEEKRAFHAGVSHWAGRDNVNDCSIGIEIANPGHWWGYDAFPPAQIDAVCALVADIKQKYAIPVTHIVGHSDVAPDRKEDPGEKFPWDRLAADGLALAPYDPRKEVPGPEHLDHEGHCGLLARIGYKVVFPNHSAAVLAFQRRFCPSALGKGLDATTRDAIRYIASRPDQFP